MRYRTGLGGAVLVGLSIFAASALAAPPKASLQQALEASAKENGERLVGDAKGGDLDDADEVKLTFEVDPSKIYKLYGVCDSDCTELSVTAKDADGDTIDWSGSDDAKPILEIDDFSGSTISVEVFMMNCKADPCSFAISLAEEPGATRSRTIDLAEVLSGRPFDAGPVNVPAAPDQELIGALKQQAPFDSWKLVNEIGIAKLKTGEARRYFYEVDPDFIYEGRAVCDCANLDLVFYDADDHTLDSDFASDNRPMIEISSDNWPAERRKGRQRLILEVKMKDCGRDSCGFAAGVYKAN